MRKVKVSNNVLKCLVTTFIEASKIQGQTVKRWKVKDHFMSSSVLLNTMTEVDTSDSLLFKESTNLSLLHQSLHLMEDGGTLHIK